MKEKLTNLIKETLKSLGLKAVDFVVEHPVDLKMGDYSTNVGIKTGKAKEFIRESLREIIDRGDEFGKNENLKGEKVMVEHTQPNPFKAFHIGHLMNNTIGESISRIIQANGAEIKTASYHGDVGMHVAKALWKGDYALGAKAFEEDQAAKTEIQ